MGSTMSNMSNAVVDGLSTTGTGSGGDGICSVSVGLLITPLYHLLPLLAQPIDTERHHVAGLQERRQLQAETYARRRAGDDDAARLHDGILRAATVDGAGGRDNGNDGA